MHPAAQMIGGRTGKRRVHEDGIIMLNEHYNTIDKKKNVLYMENRVKRLQFEDARVKKIADQAQEKAQNMIIARDRHFTDLILKKNFYAHKQM